MLCIGHVFDGAGLFFDAVVLPFIRAAEISVVALKHPIGQVVGGIRLAGNGIDKAVVPDDSITGHRGFEAGGPSVSVLGKNTKAHSDRRRVDVSQRWAVGPGSSATQGSCRPRPASPGSG